MSSIADLIGKCTLFISNYLVECSHGHGYTSYRSTSRGPSDLTKSFYNSLGHVYRPERYPGSETTNHFEPNDYYDRNGEPVCTGDRYGAHTEYAYDCAGRSYQRRTTKDISASTPFNITVGAFLYAAPIPNPEFTSMTSGNGAVIQVIHTTFHKASDPAGLHTVEVIHDDTDRVNIRLAGRLAAYVEPYTQLVRCGRFVIHTSAGRLCTRSL